MKIFIFLFLLIPNLLLAEEPKQTILIQGVEFTIERESEIMKRWRLGDRTFLIKDKKAIPAKIIKAKDFIAPGDLKPIQVNEDADNNGNTDWVIINAKTGEFIRREK